MSYMCACGRSSSCLCELHAENGGVTAVDVDALDKLREAATAGGWPAVDAMFAVERALPDLLAEVRRGRALREAVLRFVLASDDGTEYEHQHPVGEGEPECPACWADGIRAVLAAVDKQ